MINSRRKGHQYERDIIKKLRGVFPDIERVKCGDNLDMSGVDFRGTGQLRIQAKRNRAYAPICKIKEIRVPDGIHILWTKGDKERDVVCLYADDFIKILEDIGVVYETRDTVQGNKG